MSRNDVQHLNDVLMGVIQGLFDEVATLQARVDALEKRQPERPVWMNRKEAAAYLRVSVSRIDQLKAEGRLQVHRIDSRPRFHIDDLDAVARPETVRLVS